MRKLNFLYPNIKMLMSEQSRYFFGYKSDEKIFVSGHFADLVLPSTSDLGNRIGEDNFEECLDHFTTQIKEKKYDRMAGQFHGEGFGYDIGLHPYDICLSKNDEIIGRSGPFSPKPKGFFEGILYENIVEDTFGEGLSRIDLSVTYTNFCEYPRKNVSYTYADPYRELSNQNADYYIGICSLLTPFIKEIEFDILDASKMEFLIDPEEVDRWYART